MRELSDQMMEDLQQGGFLNRIREVVREDRDLLFSIREDALNIYYKGNSLLFLSRKPDCGCYAVEIDQEFLDPAVKLPCQIQFGDKKAVDDLVAQWPSIKKGIVKLHPDGNEIEFEQMLVRVNNREFATDYFIIDRQVAATGRKGRFDLTGVYLDHDKWYRQKEVPLVLLEIKFGLNPDIANIDGQLSEYRDRISGDIGQVAKESEKIFQQLIELELVAQPGRLEKFKELRISRNPNDVRFVIVLVDYPPEGESLNLSKLSALNVRFGGKVTIFRVGFGLWQLNADPRISAIS